MKILYSFLISLLIGISADAQQSFRLTFEDTTVINQVFYTDSILDSLGVWQIGVPNKPFFDSAYSPPNALITWKDSAFMPGTKASFIITLPGETYFMGSILTFMHKYDFDSAHAGCYVEFSVDTGQHWHGVRNTGTQGGYYNYMGFEGLCINEAWNMQGNDIIDGQFVFPPTWWGTVPKDTLPNGIAYFKGTDSLWINDTIVMPTYIPLKTNQQTHFMFRFTAFSDSLARPSAGWMIDNILDSTNVMHCLGGINEINSSHLRAYPDPATDVFNISILDEHASDYEVALYDLSGRVLQRRTFYGQELMMHRGDIASGTYFIQVTDTHSQNTFQKRIVFE